MRNFNLSEEQIDRLPVSRYYSFVSEYFNQATFEAGGEFKYANDEERLKFKKMQAFMEIQDLKRRGKWPRKNLTK